MKDLTGRVAFICPGMETNDILKMFLIRLLKWTLNCAAYLIELSGAFEKLNLAIWAISPLIWNNLVSLVYVILSWIYQVAYKEWASGLTAAWVKTLCSCVGFCGILAPMPTSYRKSCQLFIYSCYSVFHSVASQCEYGYIWKYAYVCKNKPPHYRALFTKLCCKLMAYNKQSLGRPYSFQLTNFQIIWWWTQKEQTHKLDRSDTVVFFIFKKK